MIATNQRPPIVVDGLGKMSFPGGIDGRDYPTKTASSQSRMRLQFLAAKLHALGPKPLFHFIDELERGAALRVSLEAYAALPAEFIKSYGGDKFPERIFAIRNGGPPGIEGAP